ncbi:AP-4 complex accessory subunit Tepsin isoform X1 [Rhipicephalus microplus]|uniref:AP-4 complex accessory subunit Tepsin isoform X1 n=2 Tax=Rhipicephalus microplus TaxID=6941 RepID=UPI003F6C6ABD
MKGALKEDLSFLKKVPLLAEATSNLDGPIPGYLYKEISSMTVENNGQYAEQVVDYLLGALMEGSSPTKVKCLRVLHYVLANGHPTVRSILARKDATIRSVANVSGGGSENQCLRLLAKDLLHAVHDDSAGSQQTSSQFPPSQQENRPYSGHGASAGATGKYQGFGNAPLGPKTLTEQVTDGIARVVDKISGKPADKGGTDLLTEGLPKFRPVTVQSSASVAGRTASLSQQPVTIAAKSQKAARKKGRAGGGWDDDDDEEVDDGNASGTVSDSASIGDSNRTGDITSVPAAQLYEKEVQSVDAFVDPSLEFPPSRQELDEARERCTVLNVDKVVQLLAAKIFAPQQSTQMRALVLIEALLRKGHVNLASQGAPLLAQLQDLQPKSSDPVQVKARKISLIIQKLMEEPES